MLIYVVIYYQQRLLKTKKAAFAQELQMWENYLEEVLFCFNDVDKIQFETQFAVQG